jgi:hypothetical protein
MLIKMGQRYVSADAVKTFLPMGTGGGKGVQIVWGRASHAEYDDIFGEFDAVSIDYGDNNIQTFRMEHGFARIDADKNIFGIARFIKADENTVFWGD